MIITAEELAQFSGTYNEGTELEQSISEIIIGSATDIINNYLMFDCEAESSSNPFYDATAEEVTIPNIVKFVCLEIASLLQMEGSNNLGINNKNLEVGGGSRTFLNVVDYSKYLARLSSYRKVL